jgi:hypothetical protein
MIGVPQLSGGSAAASDRLDECRLATGVGGGQLADVAHQRIRLQGKRIGQRQGFSPGFGTEERNIVGREVVAHGYNSIRAHTEENVNRPEPRRRSLLTLFCALSLPLAGCQIEEPAPPAGQEIATGGGHVGTPAPNSAAFRQLSTLVVKGRAPKTGYSRDQFGQAWTDDVNVAQGHNGCDTRNDILRRDLAVETVKPGTRECVILTGVLDDPYTGRRIDFVRGEKTSPAVQIDHVVSLSDAWQKGAAQWDTFKRTDFANDPVNLQATDGPTNQRKGAGDAATWLPPNKSYRCTYVSRQIDVKARYGLWITAAEKDAMTGIIAAC